MLPIQYTYLLGSSLFIIPWAIIFLIRKDLRNLLIQLGLIFTPLGLIGEYFWWTQDWWQPITITSTTIGLEDIILGFASSGVLASLYLFIFKKRFTSFKGNQVLNSRVLSLLIIIALNLALFTLLFQMKVGSFIATIISLSFSSVILLSKDKSLVIPAIINGFLSVALVVPIFLAMIAVTPQFIERTWMTEKLIGIYFLGIPLEDCFFYFFSGMLSFCVYPYLHRVKIQD
ncbi:MAG TPA: lycopene cyclase domain-containing protein [Vitreimonas sp.]|nr:lycopene cyclase domain-containing protein [Vitreimonas sp.]